MTAGCLATVVLQRLDMLDLHAVLAMSAGGRMLQSILHTTMVTFAVTECPSTE
jgi:hypothetical protein